MAERAGTVSVDIELNPASAVTQWEAISRGLKPGKVKVEADTQALTRGVGQGVRTAQADLDKVNTSKAQQQVKALGDTFKREVGTSSKALDGLSGSLVGIGAGTAFVGGKIVSGLRPAVDAASDLNEALSFSTQVFGSSAGDIEKFAEGAAESIGQSKRQAVEGATAFAVYGKAAGLAGNQLVGFSTKLTKMASDLASARNTTVEEATTAISAALRGENDPIEKYGILLQDATVRQAAFADGITKSTKDALTPQQRVLAVNNEIFRQGKDVVDDFTRTGGQLANSQRTAAAELENTKAKLGEGLLPVFTTATKAVVGFLNVLDEIPGATQALGVGALGLGGLAIVGGSITAISGGIGVIKGLGATSTVAAGEVAELGGASTGASVGVARLGTTAATTTGEVAGLGTASQTASTGVGGLGSTLKGIGAGVGVASVLGVITKALNDYGRATENLGGDAFKEPKEFAQQFRDALDTTIERGNTWEKLSHAIVNIAPFGSAALSALDAKHRIDELNKSTDDLKGYLATLPKSEANAYLNQLGEDAAKAGVALNIFRDGKTVSVIEYLRDELDLTAGAQRDQTDATDGQVGAMGQVPGAFDSATDAVDRFGNKIDEGKGKWEQYTDSLAGIFDPINNAISAQDALADGQDRLADARKKLKEAESGSSDALVSARKALVDADKGLTKAVEDNAQKIEDAERRVREAEQSLLDAREKGGAQEEGGKVFDQGPKRDLSIALDIKRAEQAVTDAKDDLAEARQGDAIAEATERRAEALKKVNEEQAKLAPNGEAILKAQEDVNDAEQALIGLALENEAAQARLRDELEKHPEIIDESIEKVDQWAAAGIISKDVAAQWKQELLQAATAAQSLVDTLSTDTPFWDLIKNTGKAPTGFLGGLIGGARSAFESSFGTKPDGTFDPNQPVGQAPKSAPVTPFGFGSSAPKATAAAPTGADFLNAFPKNPTYAQVATVGGKKFAWDGRTWVPIPDSAAVGSVINFGSGHLTAAGGGKWRGDGGKVYQFADGGFSGIGGGAFPTQPAMQSTQLGGVRKVVQAFESEAGRWEAYIPEAPSKRPRAVGVLRQTADAFGYEVVPKRKFQIGGRTPLVAFADGGFNGTPSPMSLPSASTGQPTSNADVVAAINSLRALLAAVLTDRPNVSIDKLITTHADKQAGFQDSLRQAEAATYGVR